MDAFDAVRTVLAVRQFQDKPVPADVVQRVVDAAHLTASSRNGQPWHFVVIQNRETLKRLAPLARTGPYIADAQFAVAVAYDKESPYGVSDTSRAIQSMVLTAWGDGVGSNWVGFDGTLKDVNAELGLPENLQLVGVVPFGYPVKKLGKGKKNRKPISEVVHRERYGAPWS
ncbi:MAG TPA: nitroreductase family protein [Dehalococcoidia bacterium]|jgi:nitroreductase|nr:nitroreductase family protein [Dehalococcoidia bacterium]